MILVFRALSDQERISRLRRRMGGEILGILLHVSSPGTVLKFSVRLIRSNTVYLSCLLKPLLVIAVPFMIVWGQLDARYGYDGMQPHVPVTVTLQFQSGLPERDELEILASGAVLVPPVMLVDTLQQVSFRLEPVEGAPGSLEINGISTAIGRTARWNGSRVLRGFDASPSLWRLFTPHVEITGSVPGGPDSGWYSMPVTDLGILGRRWSWAAVFLVFSMVSALAGAKFFRVRI